MKTLLSSIAFGCCFVLLNSANLFGIQEDWVEEQSIFNSVLKSEDVNSIQIEQDKNIPAAAQKPAIRNGGSFRPISHARNSTLLDQDAPKQVPRQDPPEQAQTTLDDPVGVTEFMSRKIQEINIDIRETANEFPADRSASLVTNDGNIWLYPSNTSKAFAWTAPNIRYQPLYFEQVALERYGQTPCGYKEFVATATHFYTSALLLPLHMRTNPPRSCDYPLGFCRPGNVNPYVTEQLWYGQPLRLRQDR